jgi:hypothetical protein
MGAGLFVKAKVEVRIPFMCRNVWFATILVAAAFGNGIPVLAQGRPSLELDQRDLTVLGVAIGSSTQAVERQLGEVAPFYVGDSGSREQVVCYCSASKGDDTILAFYFGALGGWTDVTRISVSGSRALHWSGANCKANHLVSRNLESLRGLKLAAAPADVIRALGPASRPSRTKLYYYVSHKCGPELKSNPSPDCEVVDSVEARFSGEEGLSYMSFYHFVDQ